MRWPNALAHQAEFLPPERIIVFPGNHDFYDHALDDKERLAQISADAGVTYGQKRSLVAGPDRYLCCTLWTDFA